VTRVLAFVPDLMDRSKVAAAGGDRVVFVATTTALAAALGPGAPVDAGADGGSGPVDLVVVDLSRPGVLDALGRRTPLEPRPRVVGFGSHVDRDLLDAARSAGCDEVLARSAFFGRLGDLLA